MFHISSLQYIGLYLIIFSECISYYVWAGLCLWAWLWAMVHWLAASFVAFGQCGAVFRLFVADSFMKYLLLWSPALAEISVVQLPVSERQVLVGAGAGVGAGAAYRFPMLNGSAAIPWSNPLPHRQSSLRCVGRGRRWLLLPKLRCLPPFATWKPECRTNADGSKSPGEQCCVKGNCLSITRLPRRSEQQEQPKGQPASYRAKAQRSRIESAWPRPPPLRLGNESPLLWANYRQPAR